MGFWVKSAFFFLLLGISSALAQPACDRDFSLLGSPAKKWNIKFPLPRSAIAGAARVPKGSREEEMWRIYSGLVMRVPHPSSGEGDFLSVVEEWVLREVNPARAKRFGQNRPNGQAVVVTRDDYGNLLLRVPGDPSLPSLGLQAHADMVAPFTEGGLAARVDLTQDAIYTGGAFDNGGGLAAALSFASKPLARQPELLIALTREEETSSLGSFRLQLPVRPKLMVNLDGVEVDKVVSGSMANQGFNAKLANVARDLFDPKDFPERLVFRVEGLTSGHVGLDPGKGYVNSVILLRHLLAEASQEKGAKVVRAIAVPDEGAVGFKIPNRLEIEIAAEQATARRMEKRFRTITQQALASAKDDPNQIAIHASQEKFPSGIPWQAASAETLRMSLQIIDSLPYGITGQGRSRLVSTPVQFRLEEGIQTGIDQMGATDEVLQRGLSGPESVLRNFGFDLETWEMSPSWHAANSRRVGALVERMREATGRALPEDIMQAWIEPAGYAPNYPGVDIVSLAPADHTNLHTGGIEEKSEKIVASSVKKGLENLEALVTNFGAVYER